MKTRRFLSSLAVTLTAMLAFANGLESQAATVAGGAYAHYDASDVSSITLGTPPNFVPAPYTDAVVGWADQSGNSLDATAPILGGGGQRDMVYPGPAGHTFPSGLVGIDTGDAGGNGTALSLIPTGPAQDALLDFTSNGKDGLSIYMVYHADAHGGSFNTDFNYLLGSSAFPNNAGAGVGIWLNSTGFVWADIDGGGAAFAGFVAPGDETIISFNYDAGSGNWTIANTGTGAGSGSGNDAAGNFADNLFLGLGGSSNWANFRADGDFGEVIIYDRYIDPTGSDHADTIAALSEKWLVPEPTGVVLLVMGLASCVMSRSRGRNS